MRCPKCGSLEDKVIDSRVSKDGGSIRRRRECIACAHRFTTYEEIERADIRVVKRDGRGEPLDKHKLLNGMLKACEKRPVSMTQLEKTVEEIIQDLEANYPREIPTKLVGAKVMEKLHSLDEVAYVRYASVYRQFQDIGEFINEIQSLARKIKTGTEQAELFKTNGGKG
ncbi:MAG TPA: transcriptional regulator NrdR [Chthoniobacteraceae bacterium]|jgi:transcriptional repressor NrdR|nr:transcriptional regulator NrdR [Chthoniobacteraceae bacterium]